MLKAFSLKHLVWNSSNVRVINKPFVQINMENFFVYFFVNKQRAKSNEQRTKSTKQQPKSNKQWAKSDDNKQKLTSNEQKITSSKQKRNKQQAKSNEERAKGNEQQAISNEQRVASFTWICFSKYCVDRIQWDERRNQNLTKCCVMYHINKMETSCVSCKKTTANENSIVSKSEKTKQKQINAFIKLCCLCLNCI